MLRSRLRGALGQNNWAKFLGTGYYYRVIMDTNNYCNLHCEWCIVNRGPRFDISPEEVELFCEHFKGIGEKDEHRLVGGETTMMNLDTVRELIDVFERYNRHLSILTNGYNILGIGEEYLMKLSKVILDDHDINHDLLMKCKDKIENYQVVKVRNKQRHFNIAQGVEASRNAKGCKSWMRSITLSERLIYPCCNIPALARYYRDDRIGKELLAAGWTIDNPDLRETVRNWRETLPPYLWWVCENKCWQPNLLQCDSYPITMKPNDVLTPQG